MVKYDMHMQKIFTKNRSRLHTGIACLICVVFFIAYAVLSIVRHNHYQSFGYDLGINNQVVWHYSQFQAPLTTSDPFPYETKLVTHVELVYALISPFYWIWSSARMLLVIEAAFVCIAGIAVYLLARRRKMNNFLSLALLIGYLGFYGVQNAVWFDVHSASFAAAFLAWFIYFLDSKKSRLSILFLLLAITAKENIGFLTLIISFVYFIKRRDKIIFAFMAISFFYLVFIYLIYFPYIVHHQYLYQNKSGLLTNINPISFVDSQEKRKAIFYSLGSFGFIPLLFPLYLLPSIGDLATYFILASDLTASHGLAMHYRITLAPLLVWATIMTISRVKRLNNIYIAIYLIACTFVIQYALHLPLSYLTKSWFWTEPSGVKNINILKKQLSPNDSVVAQNNIIPHISQRDKIYTLYPEKKKFAANSPCGQPECDWFRWDGNPSYLFADTSPEWDARHLLIDRENYVKGLTNIEKAGIVKIDRKQGTAVIYKVVRKP